MFSRQVWIDKLSKYIMEAEEILTEKDELDVEAREEVQNNLDGMRKALYNLIYGERQ